jgi:hypothetical protein
MPCKSVGFCFSLFAPKQKWTDKRKNKTKTSTVECKRFIARKRTVHAPYCGSFLFLSLLVCLIRILHGYLIQFYCDPFVFNGSLFSGNPGLEFSYGLGRLLVAAVHPGHHSPSCKQDLGDRPADTAGNAGDNRFFPFKFEYRMCKKVR